MSAPHRTSGDDTQVRVERSAAHERPGLTRSPIHLLTFLLGIVTTGVGWMAATVLDATVVGFGADLDSALERLPDAVRLLADYVFAVGALAVIVGLHGWYLSRRRIHDLAVAYAAAALATLASVAAGRGLDAALRPALRESYPNAWDWATGPIPTNPVVTVVIALLVLSRRSVTPAARRATYSALPMWLLASVALEPGSAPIGLTMDIGVGMAVGSVCALALQTTSIRPGAERIRRALGEAGLPVVGLQAASVDARGSTPWLATTDHGDRLFVKALCTEERAADLLFRAMRWLRLRRAGDAPPEVSLERAAEHEALLSLHARGLGVPTPRLVTVADLGDDNVAIVYDAVEGRSFDECEATEVDDATLVELWRHVDTLHRHGVAHRDLRLANLFLSDEGTVLVIDFGFAELSASRRAIDTDVAELLTALATMVGVERSVRTAVVALGRDAVGAAGEWLHPLALSTATRRSIRQSSTLGELRDEVASSAGLRVIEPDPVARFAVRRLVGWGLTALALGSFTVALLADDAVDRIAEARLADLALAVVIGALAPVAAGAGLRIATDGRLGLGDATRWVLIGMLPVDAPTPWSWTAEAARDGASEVGVGRKAAHRAAARWIVAGMTVPPVLVAALVAAALRPDLGALAGVGVGAAIGGLLVLAEASLLRVTSWGRALDREWIPRERSLYEAASARLLAAWMVHAMLRAAPVALAARAFGLDTPAEALLAIAVAAPAIAWLCPVRGGLGAVEALLVAGLAVDAPLGDAALVVVFARLTTDWLHMAVGAAIWRIPIAQPGADR